MAGGLRELLGRATTMTLHLAISWMGGRDSCHYWDSLTNSRTRAATDPARSRPPTVVCLPMNWIRSNHFTGHLGRVLHAALLQLYWNILYSIPPPPTYTLSPIDHHSLLLHQTTLERQHPSSTAVWFEDSALGETERYTHQYN